MDVKQLNIRAAIFDFDGTLSTLRCGWETVMEPLMIESILGSGTDREAVTAQVREYIDASTGIQTIAQMKWLNQAVKDHGTNPDAPDDTWFYKNEYNVRLMQTVAKRRDEVIAGRVPRENYLIAGGERFLRGLKERGVRLFAASGTDDADVKKESAALGLAGYFESIDGAKPHSEDCSKEAVIRDLIDRCGFCGEEILVCGDGKVEILLGNAAGARTLGIASDEERRQGVNPIKQRRLELAGAQKIVGDFSDFDGIIRWLEA